MSRRLAGYLLGSLVIGGLVSCEDVPTSTLPGPYVPPPVKGDDGRRLLWEPKPGEEQCYSPDFSPDGSKVVVSYRFGSQARAADLAILDLNTGRVKVIVEDNCAKRPEWSPDGEWIAYQSDAETAPYIWLCRPDGSENKKIDVKWAWTPHWGPKGDRVYFSCSVNVREKDYGVYYDIKREELHTLYKEPERNVGSPVPSNKGEKAALKLSDNLRHYVDVNLAFINTDGTGFQIVWPAGTPRFWAGALDWSPADKYILMGYGYPRSLVSELGIYEHMTGLFRPLTMCPANLDDEIIKTGSWGPRGDIVFDTVEGTLYLIKAPE